MIRRKLRNLFSLFDEGIFVGLIVTFILVGLVHLVAWVWIIRFLRFHLFICCCLVGLTARVRFVCLI